MSKQYAERMTPTERLQQFKQHKLQTEANNQQRLAKREEKLQQQIKELKKQLKEARKENEILKRQLQSNNTSTANNEQAERLQRLIDTHSKWLTQLKEKEPSLTGFGLQTNLRFQRTAAKALQQAKMELQQLTTKT